MSIAATTRALLDLVEADRASQRARIMEEAHRTADAVRTEARTRARARVRAAFAEQRALRARRLAALEARLATERRVRAQHRTAVLLRGAWEQLPGALLGLWREPVTRAAWVEHVLAAARARMPRGAWRIVHAPDWPDAEQRAVTQAVTEWSGVAPTLEVDHGIAAGLVVAAGPNSIDGTLDGLVQDRADVEARLIGALEVGP